MNDFRGSDEVLDREIATLERLARQRVRRYASDLKDLERDLRELRRVRARRMATEASQISTAESQPITEP